MEKNASYSFGKENPPMDLATRLGDLGIRNNTLKSKTKANRFWITTFESYGHEQYVVSSASSIFVWIKKRDPRQNSSK